MGFKPLLAIAVTTITLALSGCAGAKLKSEMREQRGYSEKDVEEIYGVAKGYVSSISWASSTSNQFNTAPITAEQTKMRNIFCNCVKKMGSSCRKKEGSGVDRSLWVKANAVDAAYSAQVSGITTSGNFDPIDEAECPQ